MPIFGIFENFQKSKIRPLDDFFEVSQWNEITCYRPLDNDLNHLQSSKMYRFCQLKTHFFEKFKTSPPPHSLPQTSI